MPAVEEGISLLKTKKVKEDRGEDSRWTEAQMSAIVVAHMYQE